MELNVAVGKSERARQRARAADSPFGLLVSIIRQNPRASAAEHIADLKRLLRLERLGDYEDYADAIVDEWARIKYSTAYAAAVPPTPEEIARRRKERLARRKAEEAAIDRARVKLVGKVLERPMPNGKPLGECTGIECAAVGGSLTKVGEIVGDRLVKDVLSERQLKKLASADTSRRMGK